MSTLKLTAASGGGTVALKGPATTTSNAALELTVPGVESGELVTKDSDNNLVNIQGINGGQLSNRNMVVNGNMIVAQRSVSAAWAANGYLTVDRWYHTINNSAGRYTSKQTADGPDGFRRCLELDVTTADTSIAANEHALIQYKWEGQDVQQLAKGTAGAKKFTVSFYVKGNGNATYMCEFYDRTNDRLIRQQFSVTSSWSRVTLTFNNETSNGTLNDDNSHELDMMIWLHAGSDFTSGTYTANTWSAKVNANRAVGISSLFSSTDNYFRITGVQMEIGEVASSYEFKTYQQELAACQRYYFRQTLANNDFFGMGFAADSSFGDAVVQFPVSMRVKPTGLEQTGTAGDYKLARRTSSTTCSAVPTFANSTENFGNLTWTTGSGMNGGEAVFLQSTGDDHYIGWTGAEL